MIGPLIPVYSSQLKEGYLTIDFSWLYLPLLILTLLSLLISFLLLTLFTFPSIFENISTVLAELN